MIENCSAPTSIKKQWTELITEAKLSEAVALLVHFFESRPSLIPVSSQQSFPDTGFSRSERLSRDAEKALDGYKNSSIMLSQQVNVLEKEAEQLKKEVFNATINFERSQLQNEVVLLFLCRVSNSRSAS